MRANVIYSRFMSLIVLAICIVVSSSCSAQKANNQAELALSQRREAFMMQELSEALRPVQEVARVYYARGDECKPYYSISFPILKLGHLSKNKFGIQAVRDIFKYIKDVEIEMAPHGVVEIRIGYVPHVVLNTKIMNIVLDPWERYNPALAIGAIMHTPSVKAVAKDHNIILPNVLGANLVTLPDAKLPHLNHALHDLTVDEALNRVALTFNGVILYNVCRFNKKNVIYVRLKSLQSQGQSLKEQ